MTERSDAGIRILFLAAPIGILAYLQKEFDAISKILYEHSVRVDVQLINESDASFYKLVSYIYRYDPNIVHFSGNGMSECLLFVVKQKESILTRCKRYLNLLVERFLCDVLY
jgi:hypothetical protein